MSEIFNRSDQTRKRQSLRAEMPVAERLLWKHLRNQALGVKFRRGVSIGRTIVHFYCPSLHLAIEVDGESHAGEDAQLYDEVRQREIESLGVRFVRVSNDDVYRCALDVAASIALVVVAMLSELEEADAEE